MLSLHVVTSSSTSESVTIDHVMFCFLFLHLGSPSLMMGNDFEYSHYTPWQSSPESKKITYSSDKSLLCKFRSSLFRLSLIKERTTKHWLLCRYTPLGRHHCLATPQTAASLSVRSWDSSPLVLIAPIISTFLEQGCWWAHGRTDLQRGI